MWALPTQTSKVTLELRELVENGVNIWDFEYPTFYEGEEKTKFEKKVIDHYYFRQIGQETVGRFKHYFRTRIQEIMPHYVRLYESVKLMDDLENPFDNVDVVETFEQETTDSSIGSSSGESTSSGTMGTESETTQTENSTKTDAKNSSEDKTHKFSNTPQGSISNLENYMSEASVDDNSYIENVTSTGNGSVTSSNNENSTSSSTGVTSGSSTSESTGTVKHTLTRKGNQGVNTYAHDIMEYRKALINIDVMIIENLNDLFLGVY